ncbi:uncharacterized protein VDAG_10106 [Verticillium dahliae VdLs.17]|uniref:Uncharacterized protein n=1 Tax=Verticillium dahliae (strain VdLs.17 / ATCC MYA-4575 / FGSC 10137) TaxID=498257 RepID=G2XIQ8_VERDV|nr:uncharacterized protein VDAG_10106 [Verticillium dahliae VdLs.17]EGY20477.1 hypothetical protein VDAG_10106 [Verticillium dahliae VdLs.17]
MVLQASDEIPRRLARVHVSWRESRNSSQYPEGSQTE